MSPNTKSPSTTQQTNYRLSASGAITRVSLAEVEYPTVPAQLTALTDLQCLTWLIEHNQRNIVKSLRAHGCTWQQIGDALQVTRSAAQQRFGGFGPGCEPTDPVS